MLKNRKLSFVLLLLIAALVLVAVPAISQDDVPEGSIVFNSYNSDPVPRAWMETLVEMWNEQNPNAQVDLSTVEHESFKQAIRTYLVADPAPDVLTWFAGNRAQFFIDRDLILPITDMWEANNFDEVYAPGFNALATVGEDQYFLPTSYYWWGIYFRPSIFEEVGLEAPIESWDELLNACDVLSEAGYAPFTIGTKFRWTAAAWFDYINMRVNGPEFHRDLMLLRESYTDERVVDAFNVYAELFEHNCFIEDPAAYSWQEALDFMIQGEAAMYLMGAFVTDSYPDEMEDDLDFFRFPTIVEGVPIGEDAPTDGFFIPASAENPEGAKAFLAWLGSQEVRQMALEERNELPPRTDVDLSALEPAQQKGIELIQTADMILQFYDRDTTPEMADAGMNMMMEFWDDPDALMELLEELDEDRIRIAEEQAAQE